MRRHDSILILAVIYITDSKKYIAYSGRDHISNTREKSMDDRTHSSSAGTKVVMWLALLIAIIALVLAWMAYNRTGEDLDKKIQDQVQQSINETQNATQDAANATQDAAQDAAEAIDAGPDGVDEDDTDTTTP